MAHSNPPYGTFNLNCEFLMKIVNNGQKPRFDLFSLYKL